VDGTTVPEAPVDEDGHAPASEHNVSYSTDIGDWTYVDPVPKAESVKPTSNEHLGSRIPCRLAAHALTAAHPTYRTPLSEPMAGGLGGPDVEHSRAESVSRRVDLVVTNQAGGSGFQFRRKRNSFKTRDAPDGPMAEKVFPPVKSDPNASPDDLRGFADWFTSQPSARERFRWVLRDSLDEVLDGQRTGRWCYQHLTKTEKTHLGTIVEMNFTKEFELADGILLDWSVAGADLDCKFSKEYGNWEIPMEMYLCADHGDQSGTADHAALLFWMNDDKNEWAAGLVRPTDKLLRWKTDKKTRTLVRGYNRDNKRRLSDDGVQRIFWLWGGRQDDLPENTILHMDDAVRRRIFTAGTGQKRINELLRICQGRIISRTTVITVAQQEDGMKRPRDARLPKHLGREGIIVLGHQDASPHIARILGLPVPDKGEFVSCRISRVSGIVGRDTVHIAGELWALSNEGDQVEAAPSLPKKRPAEGWLAYLKARS